MTHQWIANGVCDGGNLDCGSGLLLIIKKSMDSIPNTGILEIRSRESSVAEDLPAWCRMVGHEYLGAHPAQLYTSYFVRKIATEVELAEQLRAAKSYQWSVRVRGRDGLTAQVYARNQSFLAGQPADFGVSVEAPSGIDLLLSALGADLVVGMKSSASRFELVLDEVELNLRASLGNVLYHMGIEEEGYPGVAQITGVMYVATTEDENRVYQLWERVLDHSPLYQTLKRAVQIQLRLEVTL